MKRRALIPALALLAALAAPLAAQAQNNVLRVVPHANVTILDPIWTTAFVTRNHGYMIYDTLFGTNLAGQIKPQMVDKWNVSKDNLIWTFTLRDGLEFHDGKPVTSEDVAASLKRWASRDSFGGVMAKSVDAWETPDAKTLVIKLKQPFGVMLEALGKPSSNVPFIMPARIAATPGSEQIKEHIGSGPFKFVANEYKPGERLVYVKNDKYKSRAEAPDGTTGGKPVYTDRVEWVIIRDPQTQFNALVAGEVDIVEQPTFEQYASLKAQKDIKIVDAQPAGLQFIFRFNHLHAPFDNVKIRQAAMLALGQEQHLRTQVGAPGMYRYCRSMYPCGTPYASDATGIYTGMADAKKAAALLKEAGYDGKPVVLMRPTDLASIAKLPLVAKQQLEAAGFKVDMQQMDWQTLVARRAKKDAPDKGGWNAFMTAWTAGDILNPLTMAMMNAAGDKGWFGWQDDKPIEDLKVKFAQSTSDAEKKKLAEQIQLRAMETASHVPLGQYNNPAAVRQNVNGLVPGGAQVYWNIKKN
ncbi:MAG TPA: ABC transporter substrate-binding protein [Burkholderiaceae bacterium]|jgi:peptide/nickel transport system substrate-binding protein|nr:ABC transporter substrate-binding protein [Burkholderiaceae bacterium]